MTKRSSRKSSYVPTGKPPGRPKAFDEKEALNAAMEVFAEKGYLAASLPDLTAAMGINRFSMYATFGNKEGLYVNAMTAFNDAGKQRVIETLAGMPARASIVQLLKEIIERFTDKAHGVCFVTQAPLAREDASEETRALMAKQRGEVEAAIWRRLEKAAKDGELPAGAKPSDLARFYAVVIQGFALQAQHGATRDQLIRVLDVVMASWPETRG
jgi:AcrR family transcriptional regulator